MIRTCGIRYLGTHAHDPNTTAFAIVRRMARPVDGVVQLDVLSPSRDLFFAYRRWVGAGQWNAEKFRDEYVPRFLAGIRGSEAARLALEDIRRRDLEGGTVLLGCFCSDERLCHRSIVAGLLAGTGAKVVTDTGDDYIGYFEQYLRLTGPGPSGR